MKFETSASHLFIPCMIWTQKNFSFALHLLGVYNFWHGPNSSQIGKKASVHEIDGKNLHSHTHFNEYDLKTEVKNVSRWWKLHWNNLHYLHFKLSIYFILDLQNHFPCTLSWFFLHFFNVLHKIKIEVHLNRMEWHIERTFSPIPP